jgi:signal transduction histidine kinase/CheY-like chemotaxis protein
MAALSLVVCCRAPDLRGRTFRIGFNEGPPDQFIGPGNRPSGPAVQIVGEAARRRGIRLQWVPMPAGPEGALTSGAVDLWPLFGIMPDRRSRFFISKPWSSRHFWLVVDGRSGYSRFSDVQTKSVAVLYPGTQERAAQMFLPHVRTVRVKSSIDVLGAVCSGTAAAGLVWERAGRSSPLDPPASCEGIDLRYLGMPGAVIYSGVAATKLNPDARYAAAAIREEISRLALDGTISSAYFAWVHQSANDATVIDLMESEHRRTLWLTFTGLLLVGVAGVVAIQNRRLKVLRRTAETACERATRAAAVESEFLANMSHEIRTPMNGVLGTCELLLETQLDREQTGFAQIILNSAQSLLGLIDDVLDVSRMEAGCVQLVWEEFDIEEVASGVVDLLGSKAREKGIELLLEVAPGPSRFCGDAARLRQILLNLTGNALKFTAQGHVLIAIEPGLGGETARPAMVRMSIEDTGIGIAADALPHIFEKFKQANASITRKYGGTGLGLAISRQLVELMGGTIGVDSQPGQGSRFFFELPLAATGEQETHTPPLAGVCVGVAARSEPLRRVLVSNLRRSGAEVKVVSQGDPLPGPYRVLVTDETETSTGPVIPTVLLAGTRTRRASGPAITVQLLKPFTPASLMGAVVEACRAPAAEPGSQPVAPASPVPRFEGMRVLVAEDNPVNQTLLRSMLERRGCRVDMAEGGAEAIRMAGAGSYRLILMDCQMPEMDGIEAARCIRANLGARTPPVVAVTARALEQDRLECLAAGMNDYLAKPVRRDSLDRILRKWLPASIQSG